MKEIYFDVGANDGSTSLQWVNDDRIIYAFEPTPRLINKIREKLTGVGKYFLVESAVSDFNGKSKFNIAEEFDGGCNSLLEFNDGLNKTWYGRTFTKSSEIIVNVIRLDDFMDANNIPRIDYLHVDVQGQDMAVLRGLGKKIDTVKSGVIEAARNSEVALYKNQHTMDDAVKFLMENGFKILDIGKNDEYFNGEGNEVNIYFSR